MNQNIKKIKIKHVHIAKYFQIYGGLKLAKILLIPRDFKNKDN